MGRTVRTRRESSGQHGTAVQEIACDGRCRLFGYGALTVPQYSDTSNSEEQHNDSAAKAQTHRKMAVSRSTTSLGTSCGARYSGQAATTCMLSLRPTSPPSSALIESAAMATSGPVAFNLTRPATLPSCAKTTNQWPPSPTILGDHSCRSCAYRVPARLST
jgi:hypothetical protein